MALTKSFKDLVQRRVSQEPDFAMALLRKGIDTMLTGDVDTGKAILRDYIKAAVGFEKLEEATALPPKAGRRGIACDPSPSMKGLWMGRWECSGLSIARPRG